MNSLLLVAAGGAIGSSLRYITSISFKFILPDYPLGTLFVNVLGSFLIGFLIQLIETKISSKEFIKYFMIIGFLGSYTTFSTFSFEVLEFYSSNKIIHSFAYVILSFSLCILGAYFGYNINKL